MNANSRLIPFVNLAMMLVIVLWYNASSAADNSPSIDASKKMVKESIKKWKCRINI